MFKTIHQFLKKRSRLTTVLEFTAVIAIWWGVWGIFDLFIPPENKLFSYLISIFLGFFIIYIIGSELDNLK